MEPNWCLKDRTKNKSQKLLTFSEMKKLIQKKQVECNKVEQFIFM